MSHSLVIAIPGQPGGNKTGHRGIYECKCGEQFLGIDAHRKHRSTILRNEAIERVARALAEEIVGSWDILQPWAHDRYRELATLALDAAKVQR